jgi:NitT/TauT family transport system permease protein
MCQAINRMLEEQNIQAASIAGVRARSSVVEDLGFVVSSLKFRKGRFLRRLLQARFLSGLWLPGFAAAAAWLLAASLTQHLPDVFRWGSKDLFVLLLEGGAAFLVSLALVNEQLGRTGKAIDHNGAWLIAIGVIFAVWEVLTAKLGWLPRPFFSPPQALLHAYVDDWERIGYCILSSFQLWIIGFAFGVALGFVAGVALGWSQFVNYWGMPVLKLIGPVPATAWLPIAFYAFPTTFQGGVFLIVLASGVPVAILTASGVAQVNRSYYDVARTLGAPTSFQIFRVAVPASMPHVFVGVFMGLYYSFATLVVAEMLGSKYGLGWYLSWATGYSAYANVYADLLLMAVLCAGLVKLVFAVRDHTLAWQKGII